MINMSGSNNNSGLFKDFQFKTRKPQIRCKSLINKTQSSKNVNSNFSLARDNLYKIYSQHLSSGKLPKSVVENSSANSCFGGKSSAGKQVQITRKSTKKYLGAVVYDITKQKNHQKNEFSGFKKNTEKNRSLVYSSDEHLNSGIVLPSNFKSLNDSKKMLSESSLDNPIYCQSFNSELNSLDFKSNVLKIFKKFKKNHLDISERFNKVSIY